MGKWQHFPASWSVLWMPQLSYAPVPVFAAAVQTTAWVHARCGLWSSEVYEDEALRLCAVEKAIRRSGRMVRLGGCQRWSHVRCCYSVMRTVYVVCLPRHQRCARCDESGATIGCNDKKCQKCYHLKYVVCSADAVVLRCVPSPLPRLCDYRRSAWGCFSNPWGVFDSAGVR